MFHDRYARRSELMERRHTEPVLISREVHNAKDPAVPALLHVTNPLLRALCLGLIVHITVRVLFLSSPELPSSDGWLEVKMRLYIHANITCRHQPKPRHARLFLKRKLR